MRRGTFDKVTRGDPLKIAADSYNGWQEVAEWYGRSRRQGGRPLAGAWETSVEVLVVNASGVDVDQFAILGLVSPCILPAQSDPDYRSRRAVNCFGPTAAANICITQEPIGNNRVGRAVVLGVTPCKLNVTASTDKFAAPTASKTELKTGTDGPAVILWKEAATGTSVRALVNLVGRAGGALGAATLKIQAGAPDLYGHPAFVQAWNPATAKFTDLNTTTVRVINLAVNFYTNSNFPITFYNADQMVEGIALGTRGDGVQCFVTDTPPADDYWALAFAPPGSGVTGAVGTVGYSPITGGVSATTAGLGAGWFKAGSVYLVNIVLCVRIAPPGGSAVFQVRQDEIGPVSLFPGPPDSVTVPADHAAVSLQPVSPNFETVSVTISVIYRGGRSVSVLGKFYPTGGGTSQLIMECSYMTAYRLGSGGGATGGGGGGGGGFTGVIGN